MAITRSSKMQNCKSCVHLLHLFFVPSIAFVWPVHHLPPRLLWIICPVEGGIITDSFTSLISFFILSSSAFTVDNSDVSSVLSLFQSVLSLSRSCWISSTLSCNRIHSLRIRFSSSKCLSPVRSGSSHHWKNSHCYQWHELVVNKDVNRCWVEQKREKTRKKEGIYTYVIWILGTTVEHPVRVSVGLWCS